ncbi:MAG TPA: SDR family NAD(P)-dependent oxidoreductase, partial [Terriglobales bacterium]|nr:SDR family NAD(P)-dependent oxidoreductase [Terriglobales bacterium]
MILDGKVALITGAYGPIGSAIALRFAREGAVVVLNDIVSRHLDRVATEVVEVEGGRALIVLGDVTNRVHVERMVRETLDAYGRVDVLVNHAGDNEAAAAEGAALCADAIMPG